MLNIVGMVAINRFPMAPVLLGALEVLCTHIVLRFDGNNGDRAVWDACLAMIPGHKRTSFVSYTPWNRWNWRQELLDKAVQHSPDIILQPDEDEAFDRGLIEELHDPKLRRWDQFMLDYFMATEDGRRVEKYPRAPHCKAFRCLPGVSFRPYRGYARPSWPGGRGAAFRMKTRMIHYCFFTSEMEQNKVLHR